MLKPTKPKKCKVCPESFFPVRPMQKVCGPACALEIVKQAAAKKVKQLERQQAREHREKLEKIKTRSEWMKEAQTAFNKFIRLRDKERPCICCGLPLNMGAVGGGYDAGHYRSVGSAPHLRFEESNVHAQTKKCNRYGAGRAVDYRKGLIERIGLEAVEKLEADQVPRKFTVDELREIRDTYRIKARELEKERA